MTLVVAVDVDGTALDLREPVDAIDWTDPDSVRDATYLRPEARAWLHELADMVPASIVYVTARGQHLHELTCGQLWSYPRGRLYCWPGGKEFDASSAAKWKAEVLQQERPAVMIGDRRLDEQAARIAEVQYVDEAKWLRTEPAELVEILVDRKLARLTEVLP